MSDARHHRLLSNLLPPEDAPLRRSWSGRSSPGACASGSVVSSNHSPEAAASDSSPESAPRRRSKTHPISDQLLPTDGADTSGAAIASGPTRARGLSLGGASAHGKEKAPRQRSLSLLTRPTRRGWGEQWIHGMLTAVTETEASGAASDDVTVCRAGRRGASSAAGSSSGGGGGSSVGDESDGMCSPTRIFEGAELLAASQGAGRSKAVVVEVSLDGVLLLERAADEGGDDDSGGSSERSRDSRQSHDSTSAASVGSGVSALSGTSLGSSIPSSLLLADQCGAGAQLCFFRWEQVAAWRQKGGLFYLYVMQAKGAVRQLTVRTEQALEMTDACNRIADLLASAELAAAPRLA